MRSLIAEIYRLDRNVIILCIIRRRDISSGQAVDVSKLAVRAGSIYLASVDSQIQVTPVVTVYVNPAFDGSSWHGDVALVKLSRSLQITSSVLPICIPPSSSTTMADLGNQYVVCAITGWTPTRPSISRTMTIFYVDLIIYLLIQAVGCRENCSFYHLMLNLLI